MSPTPSYKGCTDIGDAYQLTDGKAAGANWLRSSTVGWARGTRPPTVMIDLGRIEPIDEVRIHTVGGGRAGVFYPASMVVLVSNDKRSFHVVGAVDSEGIAQGRAFPGQAARIARIFTVPHLETAGRYVLLLFEPDGKFVFVDEIDVIRGNHDTVSVGFAADNHFAKKDVARLLPSVRERAKARLALETLSSRMASAPSPLLGTTLDSLTRRFDAGAIHGLAAWQRLLEDIRSLRGSYLGEKTGHRFLWAVSNPMQQSHPDDWPTPESQDGPHQLHLSFWQGEYESGAIAISNCGASPLRIRVGVVPPELPQETSSTSIPSFILRTAVPVEARGAGAVDDALVRLPADGFTVGPGGTRQLWLTVHDPALEPGRYSFSLDLSVTDTADVTQSTRERIPVHVKVAPLQFPKRPALNTCTWSYVERAPLTAAAPGAAMSDLRDHYTNVFVHFWASCLPMPRLDNNGDVMLNFKNHAEALQRYSGAAPHLFYWGLSKRTRLRVPHLPKPMTPPWKHAVRQWLSQWIAFLKSQGLTYEDFAMYPFDETLCDEFYELAKFIKEEVDPKIRIYANSRGSKNGAEMLRIAPYIDIWCLRDRPVGARMTEVERRLRRGPAEFWTYQCDPLAKSKSPYIYYRLQMWRAFARGDTGCGFWTYADPGKVGHDAWDDFGSALGRFGVVYGPYGKPPGLDLSGENIVPSRRWEAWREGVEDYEYLHRLSMAIEHARQTGAHAEAQAAQQTLDRTIADVLQHPFDCGRVYDARQTITSKLIELKTNPPH